MHVNLEDLSHCKAHFNTGSLPAPYSYAYFLELHLIDDAILVKYKLNYQDRENLKEAEILEEGFSLDDDFAWEGKIPNLWKKALLAMVNKTTWLNSPPADDFDGNLEIALEDKQGNKDGKIPSNRTSWAYFLQELVQAIYEIGEKELPLIIRYKEISNGNEQKVTIQPLFSQRRILVSLINNLGKKEHEMEWEKLRPLLKAVYLPDYDYENAMEKEPDKPGKYIDHGENLWFKFNKGVRNPGKKSEAVSKLEKVFSDLLSIP